LHGQQKHNPAREVHSFLIISFTDLYRRDGGSRNIARRDKQAGQSNHISAGANLAGEANQSSRVF